MKVSIKYNSGIQTFEPRLVAQSTAWWTARSGVTNASGDASAWTDQDSSALVAAQPTAGKRPLIAASINSQPTLDFTRANADELVNSTQNIVSATSPRYVLAACKSLDATGGALITFKLNGQVWEACAVVVGGTTYYFTDKVAAAVSDTGGNPTLTNAMILEWEFTASQTPVVRINGVARTLSGTLPAAEGGGTGFRIGSGPDPSDLWNGPIADIFVASPIPPVGDKARLRSFFAERNGISISS